MESTSQIIKDKFISDHFITGAGEVQEVPFLWKVISGYHEQERNRSRIGKVYSGKRCEKVI